MMNLWLKTKLKEALAEDSDFKRGGAGMKTFLFNLIFITPLLLSSQPVENSSDFIWFSVNKIEGIIFINGGDLGLKKLDLQRVSVSTQEALRADSLVFLYLKQNTNDTLVQQGFDNCPIILDNWTSYKRQFICFINRENNHRIVWINYVHENELYDHKNWNENWVMVSGGCSNYWQVKFDLTSCEVFDFNIN